VAYQPAAVVEHTHQYSLLSLFRRYFDIGVFFSQAAEELGRSGLTAKGVGFALRELRSLFISGKWMWIPVSIVYSLEKYLAMQLGLRWELLPHRLVTACSGHPGFFRRLHQNRPEAGGT